MLTLVIRILLLLSLPKLISVTSTKGHQKCVCGNGAVEVGQGCFISISNGPAIMAGCKCTNEDEIMIPKMVDGQPASISCIHPDDFTIIPDFFEDDFLNTTNETTTDSPTTTHSVTFAPELATTTLHVPRLTSSQLPSTIKPSIAPLPSSSTRQIPDPQTSTVVPKAATTAAIQTIKAATTVLKKETTATVAKPETTAGNRNDWTTAFEEGNPVIGIGELGDGGTTTKEVVGGNKTEDEIIPESPHRCNNTEILQGNSRRTVKYLLYFTTAWIVFWCLITMICNLCWENGHHRYINFVQELAMMLLFIVIGTCSLQTFDHKVSCQITSHIISATAAWIMASFVMEGVSANRMVKGRTVRIGWCQTILNTVLPFVAAGAVVGAGIGAAQDIYGTANIHCFCSLQTQQFWIFVLPPWILIVLYSFIVQNSIVSCDLSRDNAHAPHLFWEENRQNRAPCWPLWRFHGNATCNRHVLEPDLQFLWLFVVVPLCALSWALSSSCCIPTAT